jgi:hypothetical protein
MPFVAALAGSPAWWPPLAGIICRVGPTEAEWSAIYALSVIDLVPLYAENPANDICPPMLLICTITPERRARHRKLPR